MNSYEEPYSNPFTRFLSPDMKKKAEEGHVRRYDNEIKRQEETSKRKRKYGRVTGRYTGPGEMVRTAPIMVMQPVEVVQKLPPSPEELFATTIIPFELRNPTAELVGQEGGGSGRPWTTAPQLLAPAVIGALLVTQGKQLLLAIAVSGVGELGAMYMRQITKAGLKRGTQVRFRTGKGEGRGRYVRPRPEGGEMAGNDADPYDNPDDFSWFQPWTWF